MPKVLVTAGPTREAIDPVRFISNSSSGKQGYAIAECMNKLGWDVHLVSGPVGLKKINCSTIEHVTSCDEMLAACLKALPLDVAIFTAAVTDWKTDYSEQKIKKNSITSLELYENVDILKHISNIGALRPKLVIGFSLESGDVIKNAKKKLFDKGCDLIIANNYLINGESTLGSDYNQVTIISRHKHEIFPVISKKEVADLIICKILQMIDHLRV